MQVTMMRAKIHRAVVTKTDIDYEGSISIAPELMQAANILEYEQVHVVNLNNGERLVTYAILGKEKGEIMLNGAAARKAQAGDKVIIIAYGIIDNQEANNFHPKKVIVDAQNKIIDIV